MIFTASSDGQFILNGRVVPCAIGRSGMIAAAEITKDLGRFEVNKNPEDKNLWRVPTWRNVALTAPYFHNGKVKTLDEAVRVMAKTQLNKTLTDAEVNDIVEFLNSLTGEFPKITLPRLPETKNRSVIE
jgi:cytochrome c peroxidase